MANAEVGARSSRTYKGRAKFAVARSLPGAAPRARKPCVRPEPGRTIDGNRARRQKTRLLRSIFANRGFLVNRTRSAVTWTV